jgi:hypothetical protein
MAYDLDDGFALAVIADAWRSTRTFTFSPTSTSSSCHQQPGHAPDQAAAVTTVPPRESAITSDVLQPALGTDEQECEHGHDHHERQDQP